MDFWKRIKKTPNRSATTFSGLADHFRVLVEGGIPVDKKIVEVWREQSTRGRYEHAMWKEAGLMPP